MTDFADSHPGGRYILESNNGKDATEEFYQAGHLGKFGILEQLSKFEVNSDSKEKPEVSKKIDKYIPDYFQKI